MLEISKRWMSAEELAEYLNISVKSLYNMTGPRSPRPFPITPRRLGKRLLFDVSEVDKHIESLGGQDNVESR